MAGLSVTHSESEKLAVIILAAGRASRFGTPKQLAAVGKTNMLNFVVGNYEKVFNHVCVVLGANADIIGPTLRSRYIVCSEWERGQSRSLQYGLMSLSDEITHVLVGLGDQIAVNESHISAMKKLSDANPELIVAASYKGILGVPAIFPKRYFKALMALSGDVGARSVLSANSHGVMSIAMPEAAQDIDTIQDLDNWKQAFHIHQ